MCRHRNLNLLSACSSIELQELLTSLLLVPLHFPRGNGTGRRYPSPVRLRSQVVDACLIGLDILLFSFCVRVGVKGVEARVRGPVAGRPGLAIGTVVCGSSWCFGYWAIYIETPFTKSKRFSVHLA